MTVIGDSSDGNSGDFIDTEFNDVLSSVLYTTDPGSVEPMKFTRAAFCFCVELAHVVEDDDDDEEEGEDDSDGVRENSALVPGQIKWQKLMLNLLSQSHANKKGPCQTENVIWMWVNRLNRKILFNCWNLNRLPVELRWKIGFVVAVATIGDVETKDIAFIPLIAAIMNTHSKVDLCQSCGQFMFFPFIFLLFAVLG